MRILYNKDKKGVNYKMQDEIASVISLPRTDILPPHPALSPQERGKRSMDSRLRGNDIFIYHNLIPSFKTSLTTLPIFVL